MHDNPNQEIPHSDEIDYSASAPDDFEPLPRDRVFIRTMQAGDRDSIVRIDRRQHGRERNSYYQRKISEALNETGIRVSLIAEIDGSVAGFVMANVNYGEFGVAEREAVIHSIGVDPDYEHRNVGTALLSQLIANLARLRVEHVATEVDWRDQKLTGLLSFLSRHGFRPAPRLALGRRV